MPIEQAIYDRVKTEFEKNGECLSCGWHCAFYEVEDMIFPDILRLDYWDTGYSGQRYYQIPCNRKDGEGDDHRGSRLYDYDKLIKGITPNEK